MVNKMKNETCNKENIHLLLYVCCSKKCELVVRDFIHIQRKLGVDGKY